MKVAQVKWTILVLFLISIPAFALNSDDFQLDVNFKIPKNRENLSTIYVSKGSKLELNEQFLIDAMESNLFDAATYEELTGKLHKVMERKYVSDELEVLEDLKRDGVFFMVIGGEKNNKIAKYLIEQGYVNDSGKNAVFNQLKGAIPNSTGFVIIDYDSPMKLERKAVETSPLAKYIDEAYIPAASTGIGILLFALTQIIKTVVEFKALHFGRRRERLYTNQFKILGIRVVEVASVVGASTVLGLGVTWTLLGRDIQLPILLRNIGICLFAALSHEVSHRVVGRMFKIHIEYHFWPAGSFITLLTGFLGNSFGIQGFLMEEIKGEVAAWKKGLTKLAAPVFSTCIMIFFAYLNYRNPSELFQTIYTTASLWAIAEILPFEHLDGHEINQWSKLAWKISFLFVGGSYVFITFIL
jgi:hypothetical protein